MIKLFFIMFDLLCHHFRPHSPPPTSILLPTICIRLYSVQTGERANLLYFIFVKFRRCTWLTVVQHSAVVLQVKRTRRDGDHVAIQSHVSPFSATWGEVRIEFPLSSVFTAYKINESHFSRIECPSYLADCWHTHSKSIDTARRRKSGIRASRWRIHTECNSLFRITFWKILHSSSQSVAQQQKDVFPIFQLLSRCHGDAMYCSSLTLVNRIDLFSYSFLLPSLFTAMIAKGYTSALQTHRDEGHRRAVATFVRHSR